MGKRSALFGDKQVTLVVNEPIMTYLEELARTGLYGNDHPQVAVVVLRLGLKQLIEAGVIKPKEWGFQKPDDTDGSES